MVPSIISIKLTMIKEKWTLDFEELLISSFVRIETCPLVIILANAPKSHGCELIPMKILTFYAWNPSAILSEGYEASNSIYYLQADADMSFQSPRLSS